MDYKDAYLHFIDEFLIKKNSILSNHKDILNADSLNECKKSYVDNFKEDKRGFDAKVSEQFEEASLNARLVFAHAEWLWAFAVDDIGYNKKIHYTRRTTQLSEEELKIDVYPLGFGSAGQWHTNNKYHEIKFTLGVIQFIFDNPDINTQDQIINYIEHICLYAKYELITEDYPITEVVKDLTDGGNLAMYNILTHVGKPQKYERIASNNHKNSIVNSFSSLLTEDEIELNQDEKIAAIRKHLESCTKQGFDFYDEDYRKVWNYSLTEEGFSEVQGLQYKKAIILYGPPGTSKTHTAKHLSEALITNSYLSNKDNVATYFRDKPDFTSERIHRLQLHPNYTYEDFIAGYQLKDGNTVKTKGTLFEICKKAEEDKDKLPHVLILDEINRIDLSRLFGEVFSALENRDEAIEVGVGGLKLTIPSNLFVIGTMNEIDFSLERIDFALRRRFLWFFYGYNQDILWGIIKSKEYDFSTGLKMGDEMVRYIRNVSNLNLKISSLPELGKQYQIGHTFFGEIVDIYKSYKEVKGLSNPTNQLFRGRNGNDGPVGILWDISIEPMIISFLGNIELDVRDEILNELRAIFFSK